MDAQVEDRIHSVSDALSLTLMEDVLDEPNPLISRDSQKKKIQYEVATDLRSFATRIADGLKEIDQISDKLALFEPKTFTPEVLRSLRKMCHEEAILQKVALESLHDKNQKKPIKELIGISDQVVRALYRSAAQIYNDGHYQEAAAAFTVVSLMEVPAYDAWVGLGNAEFQCQRYQSALIAYAMAVWSDPSNPMSHFYSAHCYEALKQYENALNTLDIAMDVIKSNPKYASWMQKALDHKRQIENLLSRK